MLYWQSRLLEKYFIVGERITTVPVVENPGEITVLRRDFSVTISGWNLF